MPATQGVYAAGPEPCRAGKGAGRLTLGVGSAEEEFLKEGCRLKTWREAMESGGSS